MTFINVFDLNKVHTISMAKFRVFILFIATVLALIAIPFQPVSAAPSTRLLAAHASNTLYLKEPGLTSQWIPIAADINGLSNIKSAGDRLAFLENTGLQENNLWAKEGPYTSQWKLVSDKVRAYDMTGSRLAIVRSDGSAFIKQGSIATQFHPLATKAIDVVLSTSRIGVILDNAAAQSCQPFGGYCEPTEIYVKEFAITAEWKHVGSGYQRGCFTHCYSIATSFRLTDERMAYIYGGGPLRVKEGPIGAPWRDDLWTNEANLYDVQLYADQLCISAYEGLFCKVGNLNNRYYQVTNSPVSAFELSENRIGIQMPTSSLYAYEGRLGNSLPLTLMMDNLSTNGYAFGLKID